MVENPIEGWKMIAAAAGVSEKTAREFANRKRDPLPVYLYGKRYIAWASAIEEWRNRNTIPLSQVKKLEDSST